MVTCSVATEVAVKTEFGAQTQLHCEHEGLLGIVLTTLCQRDRHTCIRCRLCVSRLLLHVLLHSINHRNEQTSYMLGISNWTIFMLAVVFQAPCRSALGKHWRLLELDFYSSSASMY